MRRLSLLILAGALLAFAGAADAQEPLSGYLGFGAGATRTQNDVGTLPAFFVDRTSDTAFALGGEARLNTWLAPGWTAQFDLAAEGTTGIKTNSTFSFLDTQHDGRVSGVAAAHASYRTENFLVGGFGGFVGANNIEFNGHMHYGMVGAEGQGDFGPLTLYGQAGYLGLIDGSHEFEAERWGFVRAVGRYFWTPDDKLQLEGGYALGSDLRPPAFFSLVAATGDQNIFDWGARYEHRFADSIVSAGFEYAGFHYDNSVSPTRGAGNNDANEHVFLLSVKFHFGQGSLLSEDRRGATLETPSFVRALPWAGEVNDPVFLVSDRRLKQEIRRLDTLPNGLPLYAFRYIWGGPTYVGVMAQDVIAVLADAVLRAADGFYRVDYARVGFRMTTLDRWLADRATRPLAAAAGSDQGGG